jgi:hypothetical protein
MNMPRHALIPRSSRSGAKATEAEWPRQPRARGVASFRETTMRSTWLAVAVLAATTHVALAHSHVEELTPDNIEKKPFRFTISSEDDDKEGVWVRVAVEAKDQELSPFRQGKLSVREGEMEIAFCSLREHEEQGVVRYSFRVDKRYLAASTFCYFDEAHANGEPMPGFTGYSFKLGSFVKQEATAKAWGPARN